MSRFIGIVNKEEHLDWHDFKTKADLDFISFFMLYHIGATPHGNNIWLVQQTLEKYSKALLMKSDPNTYCKDKLKEIGHNVNKLWTKKGDGLKWPENNSYSILIENLSQIGIDTRYSPQSVFLQQGFIETFTILCADFRFLLLDQEKYHKQFYGLENTLPYNKYFLNKYSFNDFFRRLMHFYIEHEVGFSLSGIPDTFSFTNRDLCNSTEKLCQPGRYKEIEDICPICQDKIWFNGNRSREDWKILCNYLFSR